MCGDPTLYQAGQHVRGQEEGSEKNVLFGGRISLFGKHIQFAGDSLVLSL